MVVKWAEELCPESRNRSKDGAEAAQQAEPSPTPPKQPKTTTIRSKYLLKQKGDTAASVKSVKSEMQSYLQYDHSIIVNAEGEVQEINPIQFWESQRQSMPALAKLAMLVLSVPASSASVQRVFSHGGIIFRPHRRRLNDSSLSTLIYLKRNRLKMNEWDNNTSNSNTLRWLVEFCSTHWLD